MKRSSYEKYPDIWQMVTGKVKLGEKAHQAAIREIKEESGLNVEQLFIVPKVNTFYNSDDDTTNLIPVFVAVVKSKVVNLSSEHTKYEWMDKKKAKKLLAWPGQSESVEIIDDFFTKSKENLNFIEVDLFGKNQ